MTTTNSLKRNQIVTLNRDGQNMVGSWKAGEAFKVLGIGCGTVRLSRVSDKLKVIVEESAITGWSAAVAEARDRAAKASDLGIYDTPHADSSGQSRRIVIASVLAGKDSGETAIHLTPAEESEYNRGMAMLAQWG